MLCSSASAATGNVFSSQGGSFPVTVTTSVFNGGGSVYYSATGELDIAGVNIPGAGAYDVICQPLPSTSPGAMCVITYAAASTVTTSNPSYYDPSTMSVTIPNLSIVSNTGIQYTTLTMLLVSEPGGTELQVTNGSSSSQGQT